MKKTIYIAALFSIFNFCFSIPQADGQNWLSRFYHNWLTKPRNVDSNYVYQQGMGFSPSLTSNFSRQRVRMTTTIDIMDFPVYDENLDPVLDENGNEKVIDLLMVAVDKMEEGVSRRAGANLALGRLGAGWSFELSPDSSQKSSTFLFSFRGNKWGLNINYLAFNQKLVEDFYCTPTVPHLDSASQEIVETGNSVRRLTVDGYYVINTRRFAYPPGIAGNMVQLKSAGAWMLAARFMQSNLQFNPDYAVAEFGMVQGSLGCGYSYTWVPWSRKPRPDGSGMRTFFINGTLIPMLTLYNHLTITPFNGFGGLVYNEKRSSFCWPTPNLLANATIGFSWNKFYLGAQFNYNVFHFNTRNAISGTALNFDEEGMKLGVMGVLYEWNIGLKFQACF